MMKDITNSKSDNFNELLEITEKEFKKRGINKKFISYLKEIYTLKKQERESKVEFSRKDKYIFASESYNLKILSEKEVKDYILKAKLLLNLVI